MLLAAIGLWALNLTVSRYILTHGFQPLAYSSRALRARRPRLRRAHAVARAVAAHLPRRDLVPRSSPRPSSFVNQIGFVYALDDDPASVIAPDPRRDADLRRRCSGSRSAPRGCRRASGPGPRSPSRASGSSRSAPAASSRRPRRVLLGILTAATWAVYSILVDPADAPLLAVADQRRRARARLGPDRADRIAADARAGLDLGWTVWALLVVRDARAARRHERASGSASLDRIGAGARDARDQPAAVRRGAVRRRRCSGSSSTSLQVARRRPDRGSGSCAARGAVSSAPPGRVAFRDEPAAAHRARLGRRRRRR